MSLKDHSEPVPVAEPGGKSPAPTAFEHFEPLVAEKLALSRKQMASWRKNGALLKGRDWDFAGGRVHYSDPGVDRLQKLVTGEIQVPVKAVLRSERAALMPVKVIGFVPNPTLLVAETEKGARVRVRVRLARHYVLGMVLEVRESTPELCIYEGPEPRWPRDPRFLRPFPTAEAVGR